MSSLPVSPFFFRKINPSGKLPQVSTVGSCGHDIFASEDFTIPPGDILPVKTGVSAFFPPSYALFLKSRSGMVLKNKVTTEAGVIDSDYYPKEISVLLRNSGSEKYEGKKGDKISQGVFVSIYVISDLIQPYVLRDGGFGSTGSN